MIKTILLFLASAFLSLSLSASTETVLYGDYVNCYYELQNVQSTVNVSTKIVVFTPEEIQALYSKFSSDKKYDIYTFSSEGFYGTASNGLENSFCSDCNPIEGFSCAYNFRLAVDKNDYILCYSKKWAGGATCSESILSGDCNIYNIKPRNISFENNQLLLEISSEKLDPSAFYNILYPVLQKEFANIAHDYIWSPGPFYKFSDDENIIMDNEGPETVSADSIKQRYKDITAIIDDNKYFPSCRKVGDNIISKDVLKK